MRSCGDSELGPAGISGLRVSILRAVCVPTDASLCEKIPFNAASWSPDMELGVPPSDENIAGNEDGSVMERGAVEAVGNGCRDDDTVEGSRGRAVTCVPDNLIGAVAIGRFERAAARD